MQVKNLIGLRYGKLVVIEQTKSDKWGKSQWKCHCDCGNEATVSAGNLKSGGTISCGCFKKELLHETKEIHGDTNNRLYHIWCLMKARCANKNRPDFLNYGKRGISVCAEWSNYPVFKKWALSNGYSDNLSIDRINNNGNYEPTNCRWATRKEQANNTRANHLLTFGNKTKTLAQWSEEIGIGPGIIFSRLKRGWTTDHALTTPVRR